MEFLSIFRASQSFQDRQKYIEKRNEYQSLCFRKKKEYFERLQRKLDSITDSKQWWTVAKEIRQDENVIGCTINADILRDYFNNLLNPPILVDTYLYAPNLITDQHLDRLFTVQEIREQLQRVKTNKAPGDDRIPYEFYINATDDYLAEQMYLSEI